jgi:hypothetical protein
LECEITAVLLPLEEFWNITGKYFHFSTAIQIAMFWTPNEGPSNRRLSSQLVSSTDEEIWTRNGGSNNSKARSKEKLFRPTIKEVL